MNEPNIKESVLITGGSGLVGTALTHYLLQKNYNVIILTRSAGKKSDRDGLSYAVWDIKKQEMDIVALQQADHIVHLAGAGVVDEKWTDAYKKEIEESRTLSSKLIIDSLQKHPNKVKTLVSASAIGWYGKDERKDAAFTEEDDAADNFLGKVCRLWEESVDPATALGIRVCKLRTGIVLSNDGGALAEFKKPLRFGIAGILGSGDQVVSWIHMEDLCRMYLHCIENTAMEGSYNAVAPMPVTNETLTLELANKMRGKTFIPIHVPGFVLKIMMGKRSIEILKSTTVSCKKIQSQDFTFVYPSIEAALEELCGKK